MPFWNDTASSQKKCALLWFFVSAATWSSPLTTSVNRMSRFSLSSKDFFLTRDLRHIPGSGFTLWFVLLRFLLERRTVFIRIDYWRVTKVTWAASILDVVKEGIFDPEIEELLFNILSANFIKLIAKKYYSFFLQPFNMDFK